MPNELDFNAMRQTSWKSQLREIFLSIVEIYEARPWLKDTLKLSSNISHLSKKAFFCILNYAQKESITTNYVL